MLIKAHGLLFLVDPVAKQMLRKRSRPLRGSFTVPQTPLYGPFAGPILGPPRCVCRSLSPSLGRSFIGDSSPHQMERPFQAEGITNSSIFPPLVLRNPLLCNPPDPLTASPSSINDGSMGLGYCARGAACELACC